MKKFKFPLDTVLDYKQQVLDSLRNEHGAILAQVRQQEEALEIAEQRYVEHNQEFCRRKASGMTIADALMFENGLRVLDQNIRFEEIKLEELRKVEAAKREEVVEARKDTATIEKLREKKLTDYNKAVQKSEESFIDELVSAARVVASAG